jgi:hypothetical protein
MIQQLIMKGLLQQVESAEFERLICLQNSFSAPVDIACP